MKFRLITSTTGFYELYVKGDIDTGTYDWNRVSERIRELTENAKPKYYSDKLAYRNRYKT